MSAQSPDNSCDPVPPDEEDQGLPYEPQDRIDFSVLITGMKMLPFFKDDLYLGMQAMNVGIVDAVITGQEYELLHELMDIEQTPVEQATVVSALSQMWIYGLYEVLRMWRDRRFQFERLLTNGGIDSKLESLPEEEPLNMTIETKRRQLIRYRNDHQYREEIERTWTKLEPSYRLIELFRINLAKHCSPGKDGVVPRAPGYGRINQWCGAMDYDLIDKEGHYRSLNRRDIADSLRKVLI